MSADEMRATLAALCACFLVFVSNPFLIRLKPSCSTRINGARNFAKVDNSGIYQNDDIEIDKVDLSPSNFREYVVSAFRRIQEGDINGAITNFDYAAKCNSSQPLIQRGVFLYCVGRYECSEKQLKEDIKKLEEMKFGKASELRLWHSAALNKLGRFEDAKYALDIDNRSGISIITQSRGMNSTISFFHGDLELQDMLEIVGDPSDNDLPGSNFFGSFYVGLYLDSVDERDLAKTFLGHAKDSLRYPKQDMWYHVPRILFSNRFNNDSE